ncbi:(Fe-S)-binding protein [Candidatus Xianfuyuplasma coldseepsis]|uniref:Electron transporter RnfB n=1 Tax=Candidatus Xianfuyuplasma coldseepsis TaxID=2782163 RepID=A0A7L7KQA8_9MOLU|nr:(Fe-S)-binding protein [Xianfuyuplasma coldseepsis]QMS84462.1 electron transporter RnfB [Xianfuyuplasma coldseepsis]
MLLESFISEAMPVIILTTVISIALALLLWGASVLFHVEEDPRLQDITDLLPNQNCGLCGNPGCRAMADAILREDAKLTQCKPGDQAMRDEIKEYLETHPDESGEFVKVKM